MSVLFEATKIRSLEIKNRFIRSATHEGMADDNGAPTPALSRLYRRLAKGGVGLIITGYAYVSDDGMTPFYNMLALDRNELIPKYRELVNVVHQYDTKIAIQIVHSGRATYDFIIGKQPIAPSNVLDTSSGVMPREMTEEDINRIIQDFAKAALRAREAGFDAIQIHCAHGYLLHTFICPHTNRRTDQWGGSMQNRLRIMRKIYEQCRQQVGDDFPIMVKYSAWDKMEKGLRPEEGIIAGRMMAEMGYDALEISAGLSEDGYSNLQGFSPLGMRPSQAFNRHVAKILKSGIDKPVMLVGGITDPKVMEEVIQNGEADYISMCRALIADPAFPTKIKSGNMKSAKCIQCNLCIGYIFNHPLRCYMGKTLKDESPMFSKLMVIDPSQRFQIPSGKRKFFRRMVKDSLASQFDNASLEALRSLMQTIGDQTAIPLTVSTLRVNANGVRAEWIYSDNSNRDKVVMYLHGGGGVMGSCSSSRGLAANVALVTGVRVLSIDFRLAPENPPPSAVEDVVTAYHWLLSQNINPLDIAFLGDSTGGNLVIAAMISLRGAGSVLPAGAALISPMTDYALAGESLRTRSNADPFLTKNSLEKISNWYCCGQDPKSSKISTLYADLGGLPPILIHVGNDEVLLSDSIRLAARAHEAGVDVTIKIWPEMWHVFQRHAPSLPEGQQSLVEIGAFIRQRVFIS